MPDHAAVDAGGHRQGDHGFFFEPTVVSGLRQDDEMIQNEMFGPVITVQRFTDEAEALRVGQRRASTAWPPRCGPRTSAGPCGWPSGWTSAASGSTPTSRWSPRCRTVASSTRGYGKDLSMYGFEDYTRIKHVMANIDS